METVGLIIVAALFVYAGINHIRNHQSMVAYTASVLGDCPVKAQVAFLGGWPTGIFIAVAGTGLAFNEHAAFGYVLAAFMAVAALLFHRNLKDPANLKHIALAGSLLAIASNVV